VKERQEEEPWTVKPVSGYAFCGTIYAPPVLFSFLLFAFATTTVEKFLLF
jgi:hypothetical protein